MPAAPVLPPPEKSRETVQNEERTEMSMPNDKYPSAGRRYPAGGERGLDTTPNETEISRLAPTKATVLVVGGPEEIRARFARALHDRSPRAHGPFVTVDCTTLTSENADRVLFGGRTSVRAGAVFEATRGTLYLASLSELPLSAQPRLFGLLDEDTNVRFVASSFEPLDDAVRAGRFRADLGKRLQLVTVVLV
jgi:DNA-binding NtrC family response regulator